MPAAACLASPLLPAPSDQHTPGRVRVLKGLLLTSSTGDWHGGCAGNSQRHLWRGPGRGRQCRHDQPGAPWSVLHGLRHQGCRQAAIICSTLMSAALYAVHCGFPLQPLQTAVHRETPRSVRVFVMSDVRGLRTAWKSAPVLWCCRHRQSTACASLSSPARRMRRWRASNTSALGFCATCQHTIHILGHLSLCHLRTATKWRQGFECVATRLQLHIHLLTKTPAPYDPLQNMKS